MKDRDLNMFLKALFGTGGITILIFTWVQIMPASERIFATFIGSAGILWVVIGLLLPRAKQRYLIGR